MNLLEYFNESYDGQDKVEPGFPHNNYWRKYRKWGFGKNAPEIYDESGVIQQMKKNICDGSYDT